MSNLKKEESATLWGYAPSRKLMVSLGQQTYFTYIGHNSFIVEANHSYASHHAYLNSEMRDWLHDTLGENWFTYRHNNIFSRYKPFSDDTRRLVDLGYDESPVVICFDREEDMVLYKLRWN